MALATFALGMGCSPCSSAWSPRATGSKSIGSLVVLYLTAFVAVAALVYLVYAMLRPERF